jgi:uncharacterized repeat protein (TIGR01451 family)
VPQRHRDADEILARLTLMVAKGNARRITVSAFRGNQVALRSTEDSNGNCVLEADEDTNNNGVLDAEITVDLLREAEFVTLTLGRATSPAEPADLENRVFTFPDGAAFALAGAETLLTVGTFQANTAPFRLTSQGFMASGQVTLSANAATAACDFAVASSTFPATQGPSGEPLIPITPCGVTVVDDGRLVACNALTVMPATSSTSAPPSRVVADLAAAKLATPDSVFVGEPVTYTVTVTNNGPAPATEVMLTDLLPAGVTVTPPISSQGTCVTTAGVIRCNLGALAPRSSATVTLSVTPTLPGTLSNTVTVTGAEPDPDATNDSTTAITTTVAAADLAVTRTESPAAVSFGAPLVYNVTVTNHGPSSATGVTLTYPLPSGVLFPPGVLFNDALSSTDCEERRVAGLVACSVGSLAPDTSTTVTLSVTVPDSTPPHSTSMTLTNTFTIMGAEPDTDPNNNTAPVTTTVTTTVTTPGPI